MDVSGQSLILVTAAGTIIGTPLLECDESNLESFASDAFFYTIGESCAEKINEESFIVLKDAVLKTGSSDIRYKYLYVFTDDIIAVTIGSTDSD